MKAYNKLMAFVEHRLGPFAGRVGAQRHITALRDGFLVSMPFVIIGSFILILANPPFAADTTNAFGRLWLDFVDEHRAVITMPWSMSMGVMSLFVSMGVAYSLARSYKMDAIGGAALSLMTFLLVAAPDKNGALPITHMGGTGIFTALISAFFSVELTRFIVRHNITIRMPEQVPPAIAASFSLLIPVLFVFVTAYPLSLFVQSHFGMPVPEAIMALFAPLVSASNSLPAIIGAVMLSQLLWFSGLHGSNIVLSILGPILLTNIAVNGSAFEAGQPIPNLFTQPFLDFYIAIGGSGATLALAILMSFSRAAHLRSVGRMSMLPGVFQINEPVIFGTPIVMNPTLFLPFIFVPIINATIAYIATSAGLVAKTVAITPWTAPAVIGSAWAAGWMISSSILTVFLILLDLVLYYPFFRVFEKQALLPSQS